MEVGKGFNQQIEYKQTNNLFKYANKGWSKHNVYEPFPECVV